MDKQRTYFELLRTTHLHDQVRATLLRICGFPRIHYHCSTTPPDMMRPVTEFFDDQVKQAAELIIDATGETSIPRHIIHDDAGFGAPDYTFNREFLYEAYKLMSIQDDPQTPHMSLTTSNIRSTTVSAQTDAQWMFYEASDSLTTAQFSTAMAIRLGVLPRRLKLANSKCNCGFLYPADNDEATIDHVLTCDMATKVTHATRHNGVRDEIIRVARVYGITTSKEPLCYSYPSGRQQRPDILFHTEPLNLVTDVSLVSKYPATDEIQKAQKTKNNTHKDATAAHGSMFISFVMATRGLLGPDAERLMTQLSKAIQPALQRSFVRTLRHAVSVAAARGRADALHTAAMRLRW